MKKNVPAALLDGKCAILPSGSLPATAVARLVCTTVNTKIMEIRYFASEQEALREMTACLAARMEQGSGPFHLALSGAGTAQKMYRLWTAEYRSRLDWDRLRFYWVDER